MPFLTLIEIVSSVATLLMPNVEPIVIVALLRAYSKFTVVTPSTVVVKGIRDTVCPLWVLISIDLSTRVTVLSSFIKNAFTPSFKD